MSTTIKLGWMDFDFKPLDDDWQQELYYATMYDADGNERDVVLNDYRAEEIASSLTHDCIDWCQQQGMNVVFKCWSRYDGQHLEYDTWVEATFENDQDAVSFKLVWGDQS